MNQKTLLELVATKAASYCGKTYSPTYSPIRNLSEQVGLFRYVQPSGWRRERVTRGCTEIRAEITIGIIGLVDSDTQISNIQDELDYILYKFLRDQQEDFIVVAGETIPTNGQPLSSDALSSDETPIFDGKLSLSVRFQSVPVLPS